LVSETDRDAPAETDLIAVKGRFQHNLSLSQEEYGKRMRDLKGWLAEIDDAMLMCVGMCSKQREVIRMREQANAHADDTLELVMQLLVRTNRKAYSLANAWAP
jgi:hypothetical protein